NNAVYLPMPEPAPVIRATLPARVSLNKACIDGAGWLRRRPLKCPAAARTGTRSLRRMPTFSKLFDHLRVEIRDIIRTATGHETSVHDDRLVHPLGASVHQIAFNRRIGGETPSTNDVRLDQDLGAVTNGSDGLAAGDK